MELIKTAQQNLFKKVSQAQIRALQSPEFNGYSIEEFGQFQTDLNTLYENFEKELSDNLTSRSPSLELYLTDVLKTLTGIDELIRNYQKEEIYETLKANPDSFKQNRLAYMNYYLNFQLEIINRIEDELKKKLELVKNPQLFKPEAAPAEVTGNHAVLKKKIRSNLSKVDLTVLLWLLAESKIFEFDDSHEQFVKFVEDNFQYRDKGKNIYAEMKYIGPLMAKLTTGSVETNAEQSRKELMETLDKQLLPPEKSVLKKHKRTNIVA